MHFCSRFLASVVSILRSRQHSRDDLFSYLLLLVRSVPSFWQKHKERLFRQTPNRRDERERAEGQDPGRFRSSDGRQDRYPERSPLHGSGGRVEQKDERPMRFIA